MKVILSVYSNNGEKSRFEETISSKKEIENKIYAHNEIVEEVILTPNEYLEGYMNYRTQGSLNAYLLEDRCFVECNGQKHNVDLKFNLKNPLLEEDQAWKDEILVVNKINKANNIQIGIFDLITEKMILNYNKRYKNITPINRKFYIVTIQDKNLNYQAIMDSNEEELFTIDGKYKIIKEKNKPVKVIGYKEVLNNGQMIKSAFSKIKVPVEEITLEELENRFEKNKEKIKKEYYRQKQISSVLPKHSEK